MAERRKQPLDAGNPEHVRGRKGMARLAREQELEDVRILMSIPAGRRFMVRLWNMAHMFQVSAENSDPYRTYFNEGGRNLGLVILNDVDEACPEQFYVAMSEAKAFPTLDKEETDA